MTLIRSTRMQKAMMDMVTKVVEAVLEAVVVVFLVEVEVKLFATTAIRKDIYLETVKTQPRHADTAEQLIMSSSSAHSY